MLRLKVRKAAKNDIAEVLIYYAAISPALPDAFLEKLESALALVRDRPDIGSRRFAHFFPDIDLRTWSLDRFPFRLVYIVRGNTLHVLRVDHERRDFRPDLITSTRKKK
jgi:toxin ParE1/3/4